MLLSAKMEYVAQSDIASKDFKSSECPNKDFFSKCDQIRSFLQIWSHLLKKSVMENFISLCKFNTGLIWYKVFKNGPSKIF